MKNNNKLQWKLKHWQQQEHLVHIPRPVRDEGYRGEQHHVDDGGPVGGEGDLGVGPRKQEQTLNKVNKDNYSKPFSCH